MRIVTLRAVSVIAATFASFGVDSLRAQVATTAEIRAPGVLADDTIQIEIQNSRRVRAAFSASNLGAMLAADEFTRLREAWMVPLARMLSQGRSDGEAAATALVRRLAQSEFRLRIGVRVSLDADGKEHIEGGYELRIAAESDRRGVLAELVTALFDAMPAAEPIAIDGVDWAVRSGVASTGLVVPQLVDDRIVGVFGDEIEAAARARLRSGAPVQGLGDPVTLLTIEVAAGRWIEGWLEHRSDALRRELATAVGLDSVETVGFAVRAPGPQLEFEAHVGFDERGPRGMVAALSPLAESVPKFAAWLPEDGRDWFAGHLDFADFMTGVYRLVAVEFRRNEGDDLVACEKRLRDMIRPFLGIDLDTDLGSGLADAFLFAGSAALGARRPDAERDRTEDAFAIQFGVADVKKVEKATAALARAAKEQIAMSDDDLRLLVDEKRWLIAFGEQHPALVHFFESASPVIGADGESRPFPTIVANARRRFPAGLTGVGVVDIAHLGAALEFVQFPFFAIGEPAIELDSPFGSPAEVESLEAALRDRGLDRAVIATGRQALEFRLRALW
ncbi:MAG: hypothetical protein AB7I19_08325 [Planctomycetota bacterium]